MITQKLRRNGNSFIVTVPREEIERLELREGDTVSVEVRKAEVSVRPVMAPVFRAAFDAEIERAQPGLRYLAEH